LPAAGFTFYGQGRKALAIDLPDRVVRNRVDAEQSARQLAVGAAVPAVCKADEPTEAFSSRA
jgi:hypothetical protein